jgi:hypothetical protein
VGFALIVLIPRLRRLITDADAEREPDRAAKAT